MKKMLFLLALAITVSSTAQTGPYETATSSTNENQFNNVRASLGHASALRNTSNTIVGSVYVFDTWMPNAVITTTANEKYQVKAINFNAKRNRFQLKIHRDSIYTFNARNIKRIELNDRVFTNLEFPKEERIFVVEEIADATDFKIYKRYAIEIQAGNPNPMRGAQNDKYKLNDDYYVVLEDGAPNKLKFRKSKVLRLFGAKSDEVAAYAKENRLDINDDRDIKLLVAYYNAL